MYVAIAYIWNSYSSSDLNHFISSFDKMVNDINNLNPNSTITLRDFNGRSKSWQLKDIKTSEVIRINASYYLILWQIITNSSSVTYRRPAYWFGHPNTGVKKTFFKFSFFQLYFNKKYVEVAITMHLIILKCLRKCRQKRNTMRQRDRSKRRNCRQRCFHSFNFINHASIRFFVSVNSLHFFL